MNTLRPPLKTIAQKLREANLTIHVTVGNCIAGRYIEISPRNDDSALTLITFTRDPGQPTAISAITGVRGTSWRISAGMTGSIFRGCQQGRS